MNAPPPSPLPSRADLLKDGGLYPIPVPLGWKVIDETGQEVDIPAVPGHPFHRILARGALLVTEGDRADQPEVMMLRPYPLPPGPITLGVLDRYVSIVTADLAKRGVALRLTARQITTCTLSNEPCAKVVVDRTAPTDTRAEIHYLVRDKTRQSWELVYLVCRENLSAWTPLLAEIDGVAVARVAGEAT